MKHGTPLQWLAVGLATVGFCMPQAVLEAAAPNQQTPVVVSDIQLQQGNVLLGQIVTPDNAAVVGVDVSLYSKNHRLVISKTDQRGYFAFPGLQAGVYHVIAPGGEGVYRAWTENSAPPAAKPAALIVTRRGTVRGQRAMRRFRNLLANPWIVAGIVATAVAVPVAIHNGRSPASG